ncbi:Uncharacterised protein [Klebsiella pneumoniae]|jgi:hypothetical protein|nr:Uncharacterised protein [Klebsiella pneumoniae]SWK91177.1 Uncharacterised protein [Klebsiella pneumoniae]
MDQLSAQAQQLRSGHYTTRVLKQLVELVNHLVNTLCRFSKTGVQLIWLWFEAHQFIGGQLEMVGQFR